MHTFEVHLYAPSHCEVITNAISFKGQDTSGSFGLMAHAERFMTILTYGLAYYKKDSGETIYLAIPGGLLYFLDNQLHLSTTQFFSSPDYETIGQVLEHELNDEQERINDSQKSVRQLDQEILRKLFQFNWGEAR